MESSTAPREEAIAFLHEYLKENLEQADTLHRMRNVLQEFRARAPSLLVTKCIDGRVHGSKPKGYPPTTVRFGRTDGNNVDLRTSNFWFWNRLDRVVVDAKRNTPGTPALFMAYMHRSDAGLGCAAHGGDDQKAFAAVERQARAVREAYRADELYTLVGITNTDTMAEALVFPDGTRLDLGAITNEAGLRGPEEIFTAVFLDRRIEDPAIDRYLGERTPRMLLEGARCPWFWHLRTSVAMEAHLLRELTVRTARGPDRLYELIASPVVDRMWRVLDQVRGLPPTLRAPLVYQSVWNCSYALARKRLLAGLNDSDRMRELEHGEELVCYGEGFETMPRNRSVLVKIGRGDDLDALGVARKVLEKNRAKTPQRFPPIVHLNVELSARLHDWDGFVDQIASRLATMLRNVRLAFGNDVFTLTTWSYHDEKRFYPVHPIDDPSIVYPVDLSEGLSDRNSFSGPALHTRELAYASNAVF